MEKIIAKALDESIRAKEDFIKEFGAKIILLAERIALTFTSDRKLVLCGNGGSAADAQHIAAEFVNRFELERPPLPALALSTDTSIITSIANDYSSDEIFSKQVKALGMEGDVLMGISTSGNSANVIEAIKAGRNIGMYTVGLTGGSGGKLAELVDMALVVRANKTARVQETQILAGHLICRLVDHILFQRGIPEE